MTEEIMSVMNGQIFGVWFLIGAALVFWMQAGFAMVETGFTRAKNAGNILMKNLMDFCIGTVVFILLGFGLLLGEDLFGFLGKPGFDIFTAYGNFDWSNFVFNLVFCATTATIVSGRWLRGRSSSPTACTRRSSRRSSTRLRHTGSGAAASSRRWDFTILRAPARSIWSAASRLWSARRCLVPASGNSAGTKRGRS